MLDDAPDTEKTITCKDLAGRTTTILIKGSATCGELKAQIAAEFKLLPEHEISTLIHQGRILNEDTFINQFMNNEAATIFVVFQKKSFWSSHISSASSSRASDTARASELLKNFPLITQAIINAANTYKAKIDGQTTTTESSSGSVGVCHSSSEYFTVWGNHGPTGANRAELFIKRIQQQPTLEKVLAVIWHQVKNEGGRWSEESLKPMVINALKQFPCCQFEGNVLITNAKEAIIYIDNIRLSLCPGFRFLTDPVFDEVEDAPQKSFFSSLFG